jgi:hypothetical protein
MQLADAELLRTAASTCEQALRIPEQLRKIAAPASRIKLAEQNSLNAGNMLRLAVLRFLATL